MTLYDPIHANILYLYCSNTNVILNIYDLLYRILCILNGFLIFLKYFLGVYVSGLARTRGCLVIVLLICPSRYRLSGSLISEILRDNLNVDLLIIFNVNDQVQKMAHVYYLYVIPPNALLHLTHFYSPIY